MAYLDWVDIELWVMKTKRGLPNLDDLTNGIPSTPLATYSKRLLKDEQPTFLVGG